MTVIGPDTVISGEVKAKGAIRIEGGVSGRVLCEGTIIVHETGRVKAELIANEVVISGTVEGNVQAQQRLEITATGKLMGDITAPRLAIAEGVVFEGSCTMKVPGQTKALDKQPTPAKEPVPSKNNG